MIYNRLYKFLLENNIIYQKRALKFTFNRYAILQLVNQIAEAFSQVKYTLGIFINLSKAFDTVKHNILL